jgi:hypothetical protein
LWPELASANAGDEIKATAAPAARYAILVMLYAPLLKAPRKTRPFNRDLPASEGRQSLICDGAPRGKIRSD